MTFPAKGFGSLFLRKDFWDRRGTTLQLVRRKYMAKGCFDVQIKDFGGEINAFRRSFIINGLR